MWNLFYKLKFRLNGLAKNEKKQLAVIAEGDHRKIMVLIANVPLYSKAEKALMKRGNLEECKAYIDKSRLSSIAEEAIVQYTEPDLIGYYLLKRGGFKIFASVRLLKKGASDELKHQFGKEWEDNYALIQKIKKGKHLDVMALISRSELPDIVVAVLIQRGQADEIAVYTSKYALGPKAQVALLQRGISSEIMNYINRYPFTSVIEADFIANRGHHLEILAYILKHKLDPEGIFALYRRGCKSEIELYEKEHKK